MGWLDSIFGGYGNKDVGNQVLEAYFDEAIKYPEFTYASYESWIAYLESRVPEFTDLIGELVNSNSASTTVGQAAERLYALANDSAGQATIPQITATSGGAGNTINWMAAIPEIAQESGSQILTTVQNVGTGALATANMVKYLPWILGGAAVLYIGVFAKAQGGSIGKLLGKK